MISEFSGVSALGGVSTPGTRLGSRIQVEWFIRGVLLGKYIRVVLDIAYHIALHKGDKDGE